MSYTQELINEVKELYPESKKMHEHAESGSVWLGRYLDDSAPRGVPVDWVLTATDLKELKEKAEIIKRKQKLYSKWRKQDPRIT